MKNSCTGAFGFVKKQLKRRDAVASKDVVTVVWGQLVLQYSFACYRCELDQVDVVFKKVLYSSVFLLAILISHFQVLFWRQDYSLHYTRDGWRGLGESAFTKACFVSKPSLLGDRPDDKYGAMSSVMTAAERCVLGTGGKFNGLFKEERAGLQLLFFRKNWRK